ncbi:MAG TPA: hypothetical protein VNT52_13345, partial [Acidimicrobiales bacterium]|nr:hypothetical protein [Acidimicrobiales bacterium]
MPAFATPASGCNGVEAIRQGRQKVVDRQLVKSGCGQLERQGQPVEQLDDACNRRRAALVECERRRDCRGAIDEQPNGWIRPEVVDGHVGGACWSVQRRKSEKPLSVDFERLPARGQNAYTGAAIDQSVDYLGHGLDQMLAVVQHQEKLPIDDPLDQEPEGHLLARRARQVEGP